MKKLIVLFFLAISASCFSQEIDKENCNITIDGKTYPLYGKVQIVTSFPDIKVEVVNSYPDLKVENVTSYANQCGKWEFVTSYPDFTIQFVTSYPDLKVEFVTSFPGIY